MHLSYQSFPTVTRKFIHPSNYLEREPVYTTEYGE